ncbi:MAG: aspartate-semialdehyde dehydrogenase [Planctomycetota bacterium]|jgi:aspartate-semialdehyde dehydrogenase
MSGDGPRIAIVGATGAVGVEFLRLFEQRRTPIGELRLLASPRSAGKTIPFRGADLTVQAASPDSFDGIDVALFSAGADNSRELAGPAQAAGAIVVDNSSAFRMDPQVPLVVPEINGDVLDAKPTLIANPNCTTIVFLMAFAPIHRQVRCREAVFSSYQAVSGSGAAAVEELEAQMRAWAAGEAPPAPQVYEHPIAFNALPLVGTLDAEGVSTEEGKGQNESRKILGDDDLYVTTTCVRIPVWRAHAVSATVYPERPVTVDEVRGWLDAAPGVHCIAPEEHCAPTPQDAAGGDDVLVGRIRAATQPRPTLSFFCAGDQLRKGAALNALQIAERVLGIEAAPAP